jgi:succinate dehydrogenase / fumarate reductase, cytochrome b subunit
MPTAQNTRPAQYARPKYYDLNLAHLPLPGLLSIFHRISGILLFFPLIPLGLYLLQDSLGSAAGYQAWKLFFSQAIVKLVLLGVVWLFAHHFFAGLRYLALDLHIGIDKPAANRSAKLVFALGIAATALVAWRIW